MNDLPKNAEIGKFYGTTRLFGRWGHFLLVVGYKQVNGQLAYEIHDSYSNKGKNRLFYAKDINRAITRYQKKLLIVKRNTDIKTDTFDQFSQTKDEPKQKVVKEEVKQNTLDQLAQEEPTQDIFAQYF